VHAEEQGVGGVEAAEAGIVAEEEFASAEVGFVLEEAALARGDFELERKQRKGGDELDQRRMLGVEAIVVLQPVHVAGVDVVALVPARGLPAGGEADFGDEDQEQEADGGCDPVPLVHRNPPWRQ
jgi:hypothetical protein